MLKNRAIAMFRILPAFVLLGAVPVAVGQTLSQPITVDGKAEYRERPLTIQCHVRLNNSRKYNIIIASDPKSSSEHWELYSFAKTGEYSVYQPGYGAVFRSNVNICDGQWHHLAAYLGRDIVKLYVDGKLVLERAAQLTGGSPMPGNLAFLSQSGGGGGADGEVDDVWISSGEREILSDGKKIEPDEQTLGYWGFDDATSIASESESMPGDRASLPEFRIIPAAPEAELTPANGWPDPKSYREWSRSLGGATSNRYSSLDQINRSNVDKLGVAWTYQSMDGSANVQCNPVIVDGIIFLPTAGDNVVAVDGETGKEIWRFVFPAAMKKTRSIDSIPARRGLLYWPGDAEASARLIVGRGKYIYALDPQNGTLISSFGEKGRTELPAVATVGGAVHKNILVMPGYRQDVFGYDIRNGKQLWRFRTVPQQGQLGAETWRGKDQDGANCWGGMALDESRGIAYVSTGSPKTNFIGIDHLGDNLFSDCVIALDAETGKRLWHFQEIRHDIWDMDIPASPNLVTVMHRGKRVDAVAQVTKLGNTLLLDRVTGKLLFPFRLRKAPASKLPGEQTAKYQPDLELPEPFARQEFMPDDITDRTPEARKFVQDKLAGANMGWFEAYEVDKPTAFFGIHGGAEWTGAAFDPQNGKLFVSTNHIPWTVTVIRDIEGDEPPSEKEPLSAVAAGKQVYQQFCAACHGQNREGNGMIPPLRGLASHISKEQVIEVIKNGRNAMPPMPMLSDEQRSRVVDFLFAHARAPIDSKVPAKYSFTGYIKLVDQDNYPGSKPPWGTLDCIDLNTGKKAWSVPLGEYSELTKAGFKKTGTENFGGPMATAGGLVFVSGTRDKKIRAFDSSSGEELWSADLPLHGTAPPATYEIKGRQYIVLPATGGGKLGGATGDAWVAFALPKD